MYFISRKCIGFCCLIKLVSAVKMYYSIFRPFAHIEFPPSGTLPVYLGRAWLRNADCSEGFRGFSLISYSKIPEY